MRYMLLGKLLNVMWGSDGFIVVALNSVLWSALKLEMGCWQVYLLLFRYLTELNIWVFFY